MMPEPRPRYWTHASIEFLADRLSLPIEAGMQDWPYEVANAQDLTSYLSLFSEVDGMDDVRYTLTDVIIQSFEDLGKGLQHDSRWPVFLEDIVKNVETHEYQIWYWAAFDCNSGNAWWVSSCMRKIYHRGLDSASRS